MIKPRKEGKIMDENIIVVKKSDLPVCCPNFKDKVWDEHPRVYIELSADETDNLCPYCGNKFHLELEA